MKKFKIKKSNIYLYNILRPLPYSDAGYIYIRSVFDGPAWLVCLIHNPRIHGSSPATGKLRTDELNHTDESLSGEALCLYIFI